MGEIQTYASNSGDFNFLFVLIIVSTFLIYEIGRAILDNNDDDDMDGGMMMRTADGALAWINKHPIVTYWLQIFDVFSKRKNVKGIYNILCF